MKLDARRVPQFLRDPGTARCVLLYGDDVGLIRERAGLLVRAVVPDPDDPFRVASLERDHHDRLAEEASAMAMTGGRRAVRVRDVTDTLTKAVEAVLAQPGDTLIVLEAPDLPSRAKLRALLEKAEAGVTIGCYPEEGRNLEAAIRAGLQAHGISADADAMTYLTRQLGADRAVTTGEIEKLSLLVGDNGHVDLDAAQDAVGEAGALSVDDALHAATAGDVAAADRALSTALVEGGAPIGLLRAAQLHLQRLHRARLLMDQGQDADSAAKSLRPPPFFKRLPPFLRALQIWSAASLLRAIQAMVAAEQACKQTGAPDDAICRDAFASIARGARLMQKRRA